MYFELIRKIARTCRVLYIITTPLPYLFWCHAKQQKLNGVTNTIRSDDVRWVGQYPYNERYVRWLSGRLSSYLGQGRCNVLPGRRAAWQRSASGGGDYRLHGDCVISNTLYCKQSLALESLRDFNWTRRFITIFKRFNHLSLFWGTWIQYTSLHYSPPQWRP